MRKTIFAGLLVPEPGESLTQDNGSFFTDRDTIDRLLEVGAKTHRHNDAAGLANPAIAPLVSVIASGGTIPADQSISVGYTLEDANRGETLLSNVTVVSTPPPIQPPPAAPSGAFGSDHGSLLVNTYFYVLTFTDGEGGETPFGAALQVQRPPGFASGHIQLSNLTFGLEDAGATGWRLYRATGGSSYGLLATGGLGDDEFDDDGSVSLDCSAHPPQDLNTTAGINQLMVVLPSGLPGDAAFINLYATVTGDFSGGSFLIRVPAASGGMTMVFSTLELGTDRPPSVNLSIGGAHKIDPDTELLDWPWKRRVATFAELPSKGEGSEHGDVRVVLDEDVAYEFNADDEWVALTGGEGGGGSSLIVKEPGTGLGDDDFSSMDPDWTSRFNSDPLSADFTQGAGVLKATPGTDVIRDGFAVNGNEGCSQILHFKTGSENGEAGLIARAHHDPSGEPIVKGYTTGTNLFIVVGGEVVETGNLEPFLSPNTEYWLVLNMAEEGLIELLIFDEDPTGEGEVLPLLKIEYALDPEKPAEQEFLEGSWQVGWGVTTESGTSFEALFYRFDGNEEPPLEIDPTDTIVVGNGLAVEEDPAGTAIVSLDPDTSIGAVIFGEDLSKPRPSGYAVVVWVGVGEPENKLATDLVLEP